MATTTLLDPTIYHGDTNVLHRQVVYLGNLDVSVYDIAQITRYAVSTVKTYLKKFYYLLEDAKKIFKPVDVHAILKERLEKVLTKQRAERQAKQEARRRYAIAQADNKKWEEWYLLKKSQDPMDYVAFTYCTTYYNCDGKVVYHKIGTTARPKLNIRLDEVLGDYRKYGATYYHVRKVIATPNRWAAEALEKTLQAYYWNHGATMVPQDRFYGKDFDFQGMWHDELTHTLIQNIMKL